MDEDGKLHVVDSDEGRQDTALKRINDYKAETESPWFLAFRYPNILRSNKKEYTQIQFAASVLQLAPTSILESDLKDLWSEAEKLGNFFMEQDCTPKKRKPYAEGSVPTHVMKGIDGINNRVGAFLGTNVW